MQLIWRAERLPENGAGLLGAALVLELLLLADFSWLVHRYSSGSSEYFGTTLARQWRGVRNLTAARQANPAFSVELEIDRFREDPAPLQVLIRLALRTGDLRKSTGSRVAPNCYRPAATAASTSSFWSSRAGRKRR